MKGIVDREVDRQAVGVLRDAFSAPERGTMFDRDVRLSVKQGEFVLSLLSFSFRQKQAYVISLASLRQTFWFGPTSISTSSASPTRLPPPTLPRLIRRYSPTP
jgi:hypothetical protein